MTALIKGVEKSANRPNARLSFALIYPDKSGKSVVRVIGKTHSSRHGDDDDKTLQELKFETGDFLDVAVL